MDFDTEIPLKERLLGLSSKFSESPMDIDNDDVHSPNNQPSKIPDLTEASKALTSGSVLSNIVDIEKECINVDSDTSDSLPPFTLLSNSKVNVQTSELQNQLTTFNTLPQKEVIQVSSLKNIGGKNVQKNVTKKSEQNGKVTKKQIKERASQIRKAEQRQRSAYQPKECLKSMTVIFDPAVVNQPGVGATIFSACDDLGVAYKIESQLMPFVVSWKRTTLCYDSEHDEVKTWTLDVDEKDILVMMPLASFTEMMDNSRQNNMTPNNVSPLNQYAENIQSLYPSCSVTLAVIGPDIGSHTNKKSGSHRSSQKRSKNEINDRLAIEEGFLTLQLKNLFNCQLVQSSTDIISLIKSFTKAVGEKPGKKDRLQSEFSFHNVKGNSSNSSCNTQDLWKLQLQQFKNVSSDVANAIVSQYPTPKSLFQMYQTCSSEKECIKVLEDIVVRRNAGVLESVRRIGKETGRRIYQLMTSKDPDLLLK
ncbi:crossover junction endonuclease EME1-like [Argonauta hians]